ncbi:hypothetical protein B0H16DRAFT_1738894 [Mycena metata]|uniref:Uncharacterized protein n=1 Tax=Mycena metata TaxID=1033252 RepID=A0AAD7HHJ1_9AGAR|nr:hypothetical protein B0H16DRAFT_1738894 [Mycena metata]
MKVIVLCGAIETARRVSSSAWNHLFNLAHFSEEHHPRPYGWPTLWLSQDAPNGSPAANSNLAHAHACASSASGWEDDPALNGWGGAGGEEGETDEGCSIYVRALVARTAVLLRAGSVEGCASARAPYICPRWTSEADGLIFTRWTPLRGDDNRTSFRRERDEVTRVLRRVRAAASGSMRVVGVARRLRRRARLRRPPPGQYPADSRPSRAEYGYAYYPYAGWATAYTVCPAAPIARASGLGYSRLVVYAASLPPPHRILPPPFPSLSSSPNSPFTFY